MIILFIDSRLLRIEIVRHTNDFKVLSELPDFKVYTRLKKSEVHGIGVFAIREIKKGTYIFLENCKVKTIKAKDIPFSELPAEIIQLYKDFCPYNKKEFTYTCPQNFNFMTISWFLNEDKENPNVGCDKQLEFYALKDIQVGEELFVNYDEVDKNA
jgi:SET domain-containing protein